MVDTTVVPSFIGRTTVDAYEMLVQSDLRLGTISYQYSDYSYGTIIEQSLAVGTSAPKGVAKISFVISKGPAPVEKPVTTEPPVTTEAPAVTTETTTATTKATTSFDDWLSDRFKTQ